MARDESVSASLIHRSDLPPVGIVSEMVIDGEKESIILHCTAAGIVAWLNVCPHQGRRLDYVPGKFLVDKGRLVCAAHGATFRLEDGECAAGPCRGASLRSVSVWQAKTGELSALWLRGRLELAYREGRSPAFRLSRRTIPDLVKIKSGARPQLVRRSESFQQHPAIPPPTQVARCPIRRCARWGHRAILRTVATMVVGAASAAILTKRALFEIRG